MANGKDPRDKEVSTTGFQQRSDVGIPADGAGRLVPMLLRLDRHGESFNIQLAKRETVVGRDEGCDLVVQSRAISRRHARIEYTNLDALHEEPSVFVEDLGSKNGVFVNKVQIAGRTRLRNRDIIRIGDVALGFFLRNEIDQAPRPDQTFGKRPFIARPVRIDKQLKAQIVIEIPEDSDVPLVFDGETNDLSLEGMSLTTESMARNVFSRLLKHQRTALLKIRVPEAHEDLLLNGRVVWMRMDNIRRSEATTIGIHFTDVGDQTRTRLANFLFPIEGDVTPPGGNPPFPG